MVRIASVLAWVLLAPVSTAFVVAPNSRSTTSLSMVRGETSRRQLLQFTAGALLVGAPSIARADVSDGNTLPQGALQFNRVIRLKRDIKVRYRL